VNKEWPSALESSVVIKSLFGCFCLMYLPHGPSRACSMAAKVMSIQ